jgi:hypothetical protein
MSGVDSNKNGGSKDKQEGFFPHVTNEPIGSQTPNPESKLPIIVDKIKDSRVTAAEISRLIAVEMALITQHMRSCENDGAAALKLKSYTNQIHALREVAEAAKEADAWSKRDSQEYFGPRFDFLLCEIVSCCQQAAYNVLRGHRPLVDKIMEELISLIGMQYLDLRSYCTGEDDGSLESLPIDPRASCMDLIRTHLSSQELNEPRELFKRKEPQGPETPPTSQQDTKQASEKVAPDNATSHQGENSEHKEPRGSSEEYEDRTKFVTDEDRPVFDAIQESIKRGPELDDLGPPSDLGTESKDAIASEDSEDEIEDDDEDGGVDEDEDEDES